MNILSIKKTKILVVFSIISITLQVFAQDNPENKPAYQYWDNRYIDDKIVLKFKIDKYKLQETDSVNVIISIENKSDASIFILNHYGLRHAYSSDSSDQTLVIDFGSDYTSGVEISDELREIGEGEKYLKRMYLKKSDFDYLKNGEVFFKFALGFAYIRSYEILFKNKDLGSFKTHRVSGNIWEASNNVIWVSLCYEIDLIHYVKFMK